VRRDGDEGDVVVGVVGEHAGGELVTFPASVNRTSRTSMEIGVRVATQDLVSQVVRHTNSGYFTVLAVGSVGDRLRSRRGSRALPLHRGHAMCAYAAVCSVGRLWVFS
jgi:hypothetical protein